MEKLPLYKAVINEQDLGMVTISLVDFPATESNFLAFKKEKPTLKFTVENEEKHIVRGLVMAANYPIFRFNPYIGEYFIVFDSQTIRLMAEKYLKDNFQNNVDLNHNGELVDGVNMVQLFIKDSDNGIDPKGFEEYDNGSLFAEFHVENPDVWEEIKNGQFNGFSLEGLFDLQPAKNEFKKQENNDNKNTFMAKVNRIKEMLKKMLVSLGEISTDKGVLIFDGDELVKGMEIRTIDEQGNEIAVTDGEYKTEDGKIIVIENGKVSEIVDYEAEVSTQTPTQKKTENPDLKPEDNPIGKEKPIGKELPDGLEIPDKKEAEKTPAEKENKTDESDKEEKKKKAAEGLENEELINELNNKIAELEKENEELKRKIAELEKEPAAPNANEAFEKLNKNDNSNTSRMLKKGYKFN